MSKGGVAGSYVTLGLTFEELLIKLFSKMATRLYVPASNVQERPLLYEPLLSAKHCVILLVCFCQMSL